MDDIRFRAYPAHFFASPKQARGWAAEHPDDEMHSVRDAFERCRATRHQVGWLTTERSGRDRGGGPEGTDPPYCGLPLLGQALAMVERALHRSRLRAEAGEIEGPSPSPGLPINGTDVTGRKPTEAVASRLDRPQEAQVLAALNDAQSA